MAEKQTNKDRMREIVDSIENGIKELFESDKYRKYLATMSRFHRYSVNNTMLIYMQRPDATHVAGFNKWRDQFGRNVLKGEKGIRIIAPTPYKKKVEEIKTTRKPMRRCWMRMARPSLRKRKSESLCSRWYPSLMCHRLRESPCPSLPLI